MASRKHEFYVSIKAMLDKTSVQKDAEELRKLLSNVEVDFDSPDFEKKVRSIVEAMSKETMQAIGKSFNEALNLLGKEPINIEKLIQMPNAGMWEEMGRIAGKYYAEGLQSAIKDVLNNTDLSKLVSKMKDVSASTKNSSVNKEDPKDFEALIKRHETLGQAEAKYRISGGMDAGMYAEQLRASLKAERESLNLNKEQLDILEQKRKMAFDNEITNSKAAEAEKERLKTIGELESLHKKLGIAEADSAYAKGDREEIDKEIESIKSLIAEKKKLIDIDDDLNGKFAKIQSDSNKDRSDSIVKSGLDSLAGEYRKLGKLQAQFDYTRDPVANDEVNKQQKLIDLELKRLKINKDQHAEKLKYLEAERDAARADEASAQRAKQERQDLKTEIKLSRDRNRVTKADSTWKKGDDLLRSLWKIDDNSIDVTQIEEIKKLEAALKELNQTRETIAKKGKKVIDPADAKALRDQTIEVDKQSAAVKELIKNYEFFSGSNSKDLGAVLNPKGDVKSQLTDAVMAMTEGKAKIQEYDSATQTLTYTLKTGANEFTSYTAGIREVDHALRSVEGTTKTVPTFFESVARKTKELGTYMLGTIGVYDVVNEIKRGIQYVTEIDTALTELRKVTNGTEADYDRFLDTASKTGARIGSTISDFTNATSTFAKLGYNMDMASEMAEAAIVYQNVGDDIESAEAAAESIISTMKGFGLEASEAMSIVDSFNEVGNRFAIDSKGIGDALQRSASAMSLAGNSMHETIGLITAAT